MDTAIPDLAGAVQGWELGEAGDPISVDLAAMPPAAIATLGDRIHVVTTDAARGSAVHFTLDRRGQPGRLSPLPLEQAHGIAATGDALIVTGSAEGRPVVLRLDAQGALQWRVDVPPGGSLAFWPRPVIQANGAIQLVWGLDTDGGGSRLVVADLTSMRTLVVHPIDRDDASSLLEPAGTAAGTLIARVHGAPSHVELLAVAGDEIGPIKDVPEVAYPVSLSWGAINGEHTLLWASSRDASLNMTAFDDQLHVVRGNRQLFAARPPGRIRLATAAQSQGGWLAVRWQTAEADELPPADEELGPAPRRHSLALTDSLALVDLAAGALGPIQNLPDPGIWTALSAWLGETLVVLHGGSVPLISAYRMTSRAGR